MTKSEHVYVICCRPEGGDDIISGRNVKSIEGYFLVNFEDASFSSFGDIKSHFMTAADVDDSIKRKPFCISRIQQLQMEH